MRWKNKKERKQKLLRAMVIMLVWCFCFASRAANAPHSGFDVAEKKNPPLFHSPFRLGFVNPPNPGRAGFVP